MLLNFWKAILIMGGISLVLPLFILPFLVCEDEKWIIGAGVVMTSIILGFIIYMFVIIGYFNFIWIIPVLIGVALYFFQESLTMIVIKIFKFIMPTIYIPFVSSFLEYYSSDEKYIDSIISIAPSLYMSGVVLILAAPAYLFFSNTGVLFEINWWSSFELVASLIPTISTFFIKQDYMKQSIILPLYYAVFAGMVFYLQPFRARSMNLKRLAECIFNLAVSIIVVISCYTSNTSNKHVTLVASIVDLTVPWLTAIVTVIMEEKCGLESLGEESFKKVACEKGEIKEENVEILSYIGFPLVVAGTVAFGWFLGVSYYDSSIEFAWPGLIWEWANINASATSS